MVDRAPGAACAIVCDVSAQSTDLSVVTDAAQLRELVGTPNPRAARKTRPALHEIDRRWLAASPFCLVATAAADGTCDVSPKGDPPGFTHVVDDRTIAIPERPGNRRVDGFQNLLSNPHVGLVYIVPGRRDTLRINGTARIVSDAPFFDELVVKGHRPPLALLVDIEEIFFHCAKAFMRAALWDPDSWPDPEALPSVAQITKAVVPTEETLEALEEYYGPSYAEKLYGES